MSKKENSEKILRLFETRQVENYKLGVELCKSISNNFDEKWIESLNDFVDKKSNDELEYFLTRNYSIFDVINTIHFYPSQATLHVSFFDIKDAFGVKLLNTPFDIHKKILNLLVIDSFYSKDFVQVPNFEKIKITARNPLSIWGKPNNFTKGVKELTITTEDCFNYQSLNLFQNLEILHLSGNYHYYDIKTFLDKLPHTLNEITFKKTESIQLSFILHKNDKGGWELKH